MAATNSSTISISCLCGASKQVISPKVSPIDWDAIPFCHCDTCRHHTGVLCTSYLPVVELNPKSLRNLVEYASPGSSRWFCGTCGCHIFRSSQAKAVAGAVDWGVATGVVVESPAFVGASDGSPSWTHQYDEQTKDGGISIWLGNKPDLHAAAPAEPSESSVQERSTEAAATGKSLSASCHCSNVHFTISRPDASSSLPRSNFSDLIFPYSSTPQETVSNPTNAKWWLRENGTKYLAGTCACRSCRLISGFELQTWAFVPRTNIWFTTPSRQGDEEGGRLTPLDFNSLPPGTLKSYESSPGVLREFCPRCGATVFWHDKWRPDLIDVSVGLLRAEGSRAESWLDWWTKRVSFAEDAENGREGEVATWTRRLVDALEGGLRR